MQLRFLLFLHGFLLTGLLAHDEVVLGERVGPVSTRSSAQSLIAEFGAANVVTEEVGIGEGEMQIATILFPGSRKEMTVFWYDQENLRNPSMVRISRPGTPWGSSAGLTIGSTMRDLHEANGGPFEAYGFEWDYGGRISSWNGGKLESDHSGRLFMGTLNYDSNYWNPDDPINVIGDSVFLSTHPDFAKLETTLGEMVYFFLDLMERETIGNLRIGLSEVAVSNALPVQPQRGKEVLEEATGSYIEDWNFAGMGVSLEMGTYEEGGEKQVYAITVTAPSTFKTAQGIGIGATEAEVENAYGLDRDPQSVAGEQFIAGSIYGGLVFRFANGRVSEIFLGASAE